MHYKINPTLKHMEHHRLKPMGEYPVELFNQLYKQTQGLRKKLASQIDSRKFGVDYYEVLSWFDVKFIFLFTRYWQEQPQRLLGYIISGLTTYKRRVMINSYQFKWANYANQLDVDDMWDNPIGDEDTEKAQRREFYMDKLHEFMKDHLSSDGYLLFNIQLVPPPLISEKMTGMGLKHSTTIPVDLIIEYLDLEPSKSSESYINGLVLEVKNTKQKCASFFKSNPVNFISQN